MISRLLVVVRKRLSVAGVWVKRRITIFGYRRLSVKCLPKCPPNVGVLPSEVDDIQRQGLRAPAIIVTCKRH
jgi:hypothetical protein